jgi:hypothetical protein
MSTENPKSVPVDTGDEGAKKDVESDPAKGDEDQTDWSGEGGATPSGPAHDNE